MPTKSGRKSEEENTDNTELPDTSTEFCPQKDINSKSRKKSSSSLSSIPSEEIMHNETKRSKSPLERSWKDNNKRRKKPLSSIESLDDERQRITRAKQLLKIDDEIDYPEIPKILDTGKLSITPLNNKRPEGQKKVNGITTTDLHVLINRNIIIEDRDPLRVGTYGSIYRGFKNKGEENNEKIIAIKVTNIVERHQQRKRVSLKELQIMEYLSLHKHANIVELLESIVVRYPTFEPDGDRMFLVMPLATTDLHAVKWKKWPFKNEYYLPEKLVKWWFLQIISGIYHMHRHQIAHLDIKPENVLLFSGKINTIEGIEDYEQLMDWVPQWCDFGFSHFCVDPQYPGMKILGPPFSGTMEFCAPEINLRGGYDAKLADIYSLGVLLYEMVAHPVLWPTWCEFNTQIPDNSQRFTQYQEMKNNYDLNLLQFRDDNSSDVKELIIQMLQANIEQRITMNELMNHKWLQYN